MKLDDIIEFENECTNLDFKKEEYKKNYTSLIKDVLSMANAITKEDKRIIIGVKDTPGEDRIIVGIDKISDQVELENVIQENIEPNINFRYYQHEYNDKVLGILELYNNFNRPYMMRKDYGTLKKGDMWIRKGTRQSKVTRQDLDRMINIQKNTIIESEIQVGFNKTLEKTIKLTSSIIKKEDFPSNKRKEELEELLRKLDNRYNYNNAITKSDANTKNTNQLPFNEIGKMFMSSEFDDSKKSIRVGYNDWNFPIYKNKEELIKEINDVYENYSYEDFYYYYEKNSNKLNFYIYNDSPQFLEDVVIELYFDPEIFIIPDRIYEKPVQKDIFTMRYNTDLLYNNYPEVIENESIQVIETYNNIRHKTLTKLWTEDLRVLIKPDTNHKRSKIKYVISARNLSDNIKGKIIVNIE